MWRGDVDDRASIERSYRNGDDRMGEDGFGGTAGG